jgi:chromosome partitioning protein
MSKTKVIANSNAKGGIGKTTNSLGLCYALSHLGKDVLLIDGDPQASATLNLGIDNDDEDTKTIDELLLPYIRIDVTKYSDYGCDSPKEYMQKVRDTLFTWNKVKEFICTPTYPDRRRNPENRMEWIWQQIPYGDDLGKFDLIPSSINYSICDMSMGIASKNFGGIVYDNYLRDAIQPIIDSEEYDFIIIDMPPQLSSIAMNSLSAATDGIVLNSNLDVQAIRGFDTITSSVDSIVKKNPSHRGILGILFSMYSERRKVDRKVEEIAKEYVPIPVFDARIPESSDVRKAYLSTRLYNQLNKNARLEYEHFAEEVIYATENPDAPVGSNKSKKAGDE